MDLAFTMQCEVDNISVQRAKPKNLANVKLSVKIEKETAKGKIDDKLIRLAFGTLGVEKMSDGPAIPTFGYKSISLGEDLEPHTVKLLGYELANTTPKVATVTPIKGERAVYLTFSIPFVAEKDRDGLVGELYRELGKLILVEISPSQGELFARDGAAATNGNGNGKHDEEERAAGGKAKKRKTTIVKAKKNFGHEDPKVVA